MDNYNYPSNTDINNQLLLIILLIINVGPEKIMELRVCSV
jgi:hypothetical protein